MNASTAAGLAVLTGCLGGLFIYLYEQRSRYVKLYAAQSAMLGFVLLALWFGGFMLTFVVAIIHQQFFLGTDNWLAGSIFVVVTWLLTMTAPLIFAVLWVMLLAHAFSGRVWLVPVLGRICLRWV